MGVARAEIAGFRPGSAKNQELARSRRQFGVIRLNTWPSRNADAGAAMSARLSARSGP
jgi:hypothetical protein